MTDLAKGEISNEILHQLWLERLPAHIRPHLLTINNLDLKAVGEMADRFTEFFSNSYVMATSIAPPKLSPNQQLEKKIDDMQILLVNCMQEIKNLKLQNQQRYQTDQPRLSRPRSKTLTCQNICYYHERFGNNAKKCEAHCLLNSTFKQQKEN